jgi:hypothetical protein
MRMRCLPMRVLLAVAGCGLLIMVTNDRVWSRGESDLASSGGDDGLTASASDFGDKPDASSKRNTRNNGQPAASHMSPVWLVAPLAIGALAIGGAAAWFVWRSKRASHQPRSHALAAHLLQTRLREARPARISPSQPNTTRRAA